MTDPTIGFSSGNQMRINADKVAMNGNLRFLQDSLSVRNEQVDQAINTAEILKSEVESLNAELTTFETAFIGLSGVTRELMTELRILDPTNPLLNKAVRDIIYDGNREAYYNVIKNETYLQRKAKFPQRRNEIYGLENSTKSGPDSHAIVHNAKLRKARGIPDPAPPKTESAIANENELLKENQKKMMGLIEVLLNEVKSINPDSSVISESSLKATFETFALHEMEKSSAKKSNPG